MEQLTEVILGAEQSGNRSSLPEALKVLHFVQTIKLLSALVFPRKTLQAKIFTNNERKKSEKVITKQFVDIPNRPACRSRSEDSFYGQIWSPNSFRFLRSFRSAVTYYCVHICRECEQSNNLIICVMSR